MRRVILQPHSVTRVSCQTAFPLATELWGICNPLPDPALERAHIALYDTMLLTLPTSGLIDLWVTNFSDSVRKLKQALPIAVFLSTDKDKYELLFPFAENDDACGGNRHQQLGDSDRRLISAQEPDDNERRLETAIKLNSKQLDDASSTMDSMGLKQSPLSGNLGDKMALNISPVPDNHRTTSNSEPHQPSAPEAVPITLKTTCVGNVKFKTLRTSTTFNPLDSNTDDEKETSNDSCASNDTGSTCESSTFSRQKLDQFKEDFGNTLLSDSTLYCERAIEATHR